MGSAGSPDAQIIADDIERLSAQLFHLKAGVAKLQAEIEMQLEALASVSSKVVDTPSLVGEVGSEAVGDVSAKELTTNEACVELAELERFITALEGTVRKPSQNAASEAPGAGVASAMGNSLDASTDDLTRLKGVTPGIAQKLSGLGYKTFAAISALTARDVDHIHAELGLEESISKSNWIEQAELLRQGTETYHLRHARISGRPATISYPRSDLNPMNHLIALRKSRSNQATNADIAARAAEISGGIASRFVIAASLAALITVAHSNKIEIRPLQWVPQLQELASCGNAILAGEGTCARLTWSRF